MKAFVLTLCLCAAVVCAATEATFKFRKEKEQGFPVGVRVRTAAPAEIQKTDCPILVTVRWTYAKRMDGGPKKKEELDAILLWEGKLDQLLTAKQVGFHFLSRIGRGKVLSSFYVSDAQRLRDLSVEAGAVSDTDQITYTIGDDPTWSEWQKND